MEEILKSGLLNLTELAARLYPEKTRTAASNLLRMKVNRQGFNKLTDDERSTIADLISFESNAIDRAFETPNEISALTYPVLLDAAKKYWESAQHHKILKGADPKHYETGFVYGVRFARGIKP